MNERETQMREPERDGGNYEAQAASSAPTAPPRERQMEQGPAQSNDPNAIDERASTTKTQPMARLESENRQPTDDQSSDGRLIQDQKWQDFAGRWDSIQGGFVDDPRRTVEQADRLVAEVIDHLSKMFTDERAKLEAQWSKSGQADTEDLRIAMQRYREFFRTLVGR